MARRLIVTRRSIAAGSLPSDGTFKSKVLACLAIDLFAIRLNGREGLIKEAAHA
jgi:hypothetical protein